MKPGTKLLILALFAVAALCSCNVFKPNSGHCPTNDKTFFYKHR